MYTVKRHMAFAAAVLVCLAYIAPAKAGSDLTVSTVHAKSEIWPKEFMAIGNLQARWGTDLSFQTSGLVSEIDFRSGDEVTAGTVLAKLTLNDEPGLLEAYQSQAASDEIIFNRNTKQFQANAISRAEVDRDRLAWRADLGHAHAEQALIDMKTLKAPFTGRLGVRQVNPGQYLQPGTMVVTLQNTDIVYVDFYIPQNQSSILKTETPVRVTVDAWEGRNFVGQITAITPQVNQLSRTILVRATLENHDHALVPGMFAAVHMTYGNADRMITLPKSALVYATYGDSVWVLNQSDHHANDDPQSASQSNSLTAHRIRVKAGQSKGDRISVSGITVDQQVVVAGQTKLYEGASVTVDNSILPDASTDPQPEEE